MDDSVVDEHCRRQPAEPLRRYVAWYTGYRQRGVPPARHRGLPAPFLTLIFTLDEPLTVVTHPDPGQPGSDFTALLGGLHATPALITHDGAQSGIQLAVRPLGARALLGLPAGELGSLDVPAEAVFGPDCGALRTRLVEAPGWAERFALLDQALLTRLGRFAGPAAARDVPPEVAWSWAALLRSGGSVSVAALTGETGWSARHLSGRFRAETGLAPKAAARVIRFHRARRRLAAAATDVTSVPVRMADLAVSCGYFDQAHMAREFRALAGCPPSVWLAEEFRNVQAGAWLYTEAWD